MSIVKNIIILVAGLFALMPIVAAAASGSISGNLIMPTPYSQSIDMTIIVLAYSPDDITPRQHQLTITTAEAVAGFTKAFTISGLLSGKTYTLQYDCNSFSSLEACKNIVPRGYYKATGQTIVRAENASTFSGDLVYSAINLPVLSGESVTGTMSLPDGTLASDLTYSIRAQSVAEPTIMLTVGRNVITAGDSSDNYKITIPDDASEDWTIGYICTDGGSCNDFLPFGYHKSSITNETVEDRASADSLAGDASHSSKDMTLLSGYTISGTLTAPQPVTDAGGMPVRVIVAASNNALVVFDTQINIPIAGTTADYSVTVSLDGTADWSVRYSCSTSSSPIDCANYVSQGFYDSSVNITNATPNSIDAELLAGGGSHANIDFSLLTGNSISGKLQLSAGQAPAGGIAFTVYATNILGGGGSFLTTTTINEGETEADYRINVGPDGASSYRVNFDCTETITVICNDLSDKRYYDATPGVTVDVEGDADPLAGGIDHIDINMEVESSALVAGLCVPIKTSTGGIAIVCL